MGVDAAARGEPLIDLRGHSSRYRELPPVAPADQAERRDSGSQPPHPRHLDPLPDLGACYVS